MLNLLSFNHSVLSAPMGIDVSEHTSGYSTLKIMGSQNIGSEPTNKECNVTQVKRSSKTRVSITKYNTEQEKK